MSAERQRLSHVDRAGRPRMVDIAEKAVTERIASAEAQVRFPPATAARLRADGLRVAKGAVIDTAIVAGSMAVKRTADLIPFCHPLPIHGCELSIEWGERNCLRIVCRVRTQARTGVEMEALTGASVAALTVYDMCKALSHRIEIGPVRLLAKRGGRRDVGEQPEAP